ncbi:MAG: hypothetical protein B7L53_01200 [Thermofilum sp. NZ13]|nr:MAG: hypothetical protein B7L53_01200 [Thermofilum sp. NZ13]
MDGIKIWHKASKTKSSNPYALGRPLFEIRKTKSHLHRHQALLFYSMMSLKLPRPGLVRLVRFDFDNIREEFKALATSLAEGG